MPPPNEQNQVSPPSSLLEHVHNSTAIESIEAALENTHPTTIAQSPLSRPRRECGDLHLTPCTLEQYRELDQRSEDPYELVDGLLASLPSMHTEHGYIVYGLSLLFRFLSDTIPNPVRVYSQKAYLLSAGNEGHNRRRATIRLPDLYVVLKSEQSYSSDVHDATFEGQRHADWKTAQMVVEVTSTNRDTDLVPKREEYKQAKIPVYVIIDRQKGVPDRRPCVEVHTLDRRGSYKKRVYYGDQQVDCPYFSHWKLTADNMFDYEALLRIYKQEKKKRDRAKNERDRAEKQRDLAEKERDLAEKERDLAEKERDRAEKERDRAEKERDRAEKERDRAEKERDRAEKERDLTEKERDLTEKERDRAEKERDRTEKERNRAEKERDRTEKERGRQEKRADRAEKERERAEKELEEQKKGHEENRQHYIDFFKGRRKTPPPELELEDSQLKYHNATSGSKFAGSSKRSVPKSPSSPRSPTPSQRRPASSKSPTSPKSPKSPPRRVRKVDDSDVKRVARNGKDQL